MRIKPYAGTSLERLTRLLSTNAKQDLVHGKDFTVGVPGTFTDSVGRNTELQMKVLTPGYLTVQPVQYRRLDLKVLAKLPPKLVRRPRVPKLPFQIHELLPSINRSLGLNLLPGEVENNTYKLKQPSYRLVIRESVSLAWIGSYDFKVIHEGEQVPLPEVITEYLLDGLRNPSANVYEELLKLLNEVNDPDVALNGTNVSFVTPRPDKFTPDPFYNTRITVEAVKGGGYLGSVDAFYHRILLSELSGEWELVTESPITLQLLFDLINQQAATDLTVNDVEPVVVPDMAIGDIVAFDLKPKADSLKWVGERVFRTLFGLPPNLSKLHVLMNNTLPSAGYIT